MKEKDLDPLQILVVPHEVVKWYRQQDLLTKKFFPKKAKRLKEAGKYAIFHNTLRLNGLFNTEKEACNRIDEIVGSKRKCIENVRIFSIKQLI